MSNTIKSDRGIADSAIRELVGLDTSQVENKQVTFNYTTEITGMESAKLTSNCMLQAVCDFSQAVLLQANKFPQIAAKIEKRDIEEAQRWSK